MSLLGLRIVVYYIVCNMWTKCVRSLYNRKKIWITITGQQVFRVDRIDYLDGLITQGHLWNQRNNFFQLCVRFVAGLKNETTQHGLPTAC